MTRSTQAAAVVLAAPFLVMVVVLDGMKTALPIFHGTDEIVYHYPTILRFARQLPFPDLHAYRAAQTPLYHLLMAYVGEVTGDELWRLRLVQVLISYLLILAVFRLLRSTVGMAVSAATVLTMLVELSPYFFGQSFRLGTDNLALLFVVIAIERFESFRRRSELAPFIGGCACVGAATLTRQSAAFMAGFGLLYAVSPGCTVSFRDRGIAVCAMCVALLPAIALFVDWHGLVPVGSDPSSCGLCVARGHGVGLSAHGLEVPTLELALAAIGAYGLILFAPQLVNAIATRAAPLSRAARPGLVAAVICALLLLAFPAAGGHDAAGTLWKLASHLPVLDGSSILFWLLVPLGGAVLATRQRVASFQMLSAVLAGTFLLSTLAIRLPWEKYTDPLALLWLIVSTVPADTHRVRFRFAGAAVLAALFVAYAAQTAATVRAYPSRAPAMLLSHVAHD